MLMECNFLDPFRTDKLEIIRGEVECSEHYKIWNTYNMVFRCQ